MPNEKIEVRYSPIIAGTHHKYIVYTDSNGNQKIAHGGPKDSLILNRDFGPIETRTRNSNWKF